MDYCTSCLRELNGVVSCPGCGAVVESMPGAQEPPADVRIRHAAEGSRNPVPTKANHGAGAADAA